MLLLLTLLAAAPSAWAKPVIGHPYGSYNFPQSAILCRTEEGMPSETDRLPIAAQKPDSEESQWAPSADMSSAYLRINPSNALLIGQELKSSPHSGSTTSLGAEVRSPPASLWPPVPTYSDPNSHHAPSPVHHPHPPHPPSIFPPDEHASEIHSPLPPSPFGDEVHYPPDGHPFLPEMNSWDENSGRVSANMPPYSPEVYHPGIQEPYPSDTYNTEDEASPLHGFPLQAPIPPDAFERNIMDRVPQHY